MSDAHDTAPFQPFLEQYSRILIRELYDVLARRDEAVLDYLEKRLQAQEARVDGFNTFKANMESLSDVVLSQMWGERSGE